MKRSRTCYSSLVDLDSGLVTTSGDDDTPHLNAKQRKRDLPWELLNGIPEKRIEKLLIRDPRDPVTDSKQPDEKELQKAKKTKARSGFAAAKIMNQSYESYPSLYSTIIERRSDNRVIALKKPLFNFGESDANADISRYSSFDSELEACTSGEDISDIDKSFHSETSKRYSPKTFSTTSSSGSSSPKAFSTTSSSGDESDGGPVFF